MNKSMSAIAEYGKKLFDDSLCGENDYIIYRINAQKAYVVNGELQNLQEKDFNEIIYTTDERVGAKILLAKPDVNAVICTHPKKVAVVAKAKRDIPAVLDDMAQIVGIKAKVCDNSVNSIVKGLKKANSILVTDGSAITTGRTLNEAFTCCLVLEKAATVFVDASVIGGCHVINTLEAKLMRFVYKMKYSKKNQAQLQAEEGK